MVKFKGTSIGLRLTILGEQTNISASRCLTLPSRTHVPVLWPTPLSIRVQWRKSLSIKRAPRASSRWRSSCKSSPAPAQKTRPTSQLSEAPQPRSTQPDLIQSSNANGEQHSTYYGMQACLTSTIDRQLVTLSNHNHNHLHSVSIVICRDFRLKQIKQFARSLFV